MSKPKPPYKFFAKTWEAGDCIYGGVAIKLGNTCITVANYFIEGAEDAGWPDDTKEEISEQEARENKKTSKLINKAIKMFESGKTPNEIDEYFRNEFPRVD